MDYEYWLHLGTYRESYIVYISMIVVICATELIFLALLGTRLLCLMYRHHNAEFKVNRLWMILFGVFIFYEQIFELSTYVDLYQWNVNDNTKKHFKLTRTNILWNILGIKHLIVPIFIIFLKGHFDLFKSFSKLDSLARVSIFQVATISTDDMNRSTGTIELKQKCCCGLFFIR